MLSSNARVLTLRVRLAVAVHSRANSRPLPEGSVKSTGFLKSSPCSDFSDRERTAGKQLDGDVTAQLVFELPVVRAFGQQTALQSGRG